MKAILLALVATIATSSFAQADIARPKGKVTELARVENKKNYPGRDAATETFLTASVKSDGQLVVTTTKRRAVIAKLTRAQLTVVRNASKPLSLAKIETINRRIVCKMLPPPFRPHLYIGEKLITNVNSCSYRTIVDPADERMVELADKVQKLIVNLATDAVEKN